MKLTAILGLIGTVMIAAAYIPHIRHMVEEHCAGGVSKRAWSIWMVATVLILIHAVHTSDTVFISLQVVNLLAILIIMLLASHYEDQICHSVEERISSPAEAEIE